MSRSPRKLLRTATLALQSLREVWEQHPPARAEAVATLGEQRVTELERMAESVGEAAAALDAAGAGTPEESEPPPRGPARS